MKRDGRFFWPAGRDEESTEDGGMDGGRGRAEGGGAWTATKVSITSGQEGFS